MIGDLVQPTHLLLILIVALLVLGPKRLPEVGRSLGKGLRDFKDAVSNYQPDRLLEGDDEPAARAAAAPHSDARSDLPATPDAPTQPQPVAQPQAPARPEASDTGETPTTVHDPQPAPVVQPEPLDAEIVPDEHAQRTTR
jgi:sec-independent protein translocase protein TatA